MSSELKIIGLIFILSCFNYPNANGSEIGYPDPKGCTYNSTSTRYTYCKTFPIREILHQYEIYLSFFVKAERDAHIIFAPEEEPAQKGEQAYEIVLGSYKNTISSIRVVRNGKEKFIHREANILSKYEWRQFWIRINSDGEIKVGKRNEIRPFMAWKHDRALMIEHYGFASLHHNKVEWLFPCF